MLNKKAAFVTLQTLKQCRADMVQDFLSHNTEIYKPSYKYENSPVMLKLAREKYFITWLSSHWQVFNHIVAHLPGEERSIIDTFFTPVFLELLSKWAIVKTTDSSQLNLGVELVKDMQTALSQFMKAGENADTMRNILEVTLEKNRVVFDRIIKQFSEEKL
ncbi:hypothetical protein [Methylotuvimicrobium buryatense]|uniref:Uncharacterized protein n=1 Tax=Methylotuvimicrobium buryatense TaxID=95641 RepID=A0A4P9UJ63_METBY|nr:hypothetical protein [Methylotuvimicrobium buryatense]QCW81027.1 hypothetical protein EQU24_01230 [Methylotuvimicrobium buryatense]